MYSLITLVLCLSPFCCFFTFPTFFLTTSVRWQFSRRCSWKRWTFLISAWSARRLARGGAVCTPPSPIGPSSRRGRRRGRTAAGSARAARNRSCWRPGLCGSRASSLWAPWRRWSSCSRWSVASGVWCLYVPLSDPQIHYDCKRPETTVIFHFRCVLDQS